MLIRLLWNFWPSNKCIVDCHMEIFQMFSYQYLYVLFQSKLHQTSATSIMERKEVCFSVFNSHPITIINPLVWAEAVILMGFHAGGCAVFCVTRCFGKAKHAVTLTLLGLPLSHVMLNPTAWCCSAKTNEVHLMNANERWTLNIGLKTEFRNKDPALRLPCINVLQTFLSCECLHMSNLLL